NHVVADRRSKLFGEDDFVAVGQRHDDDDPTDTWPLDKLPMAGFDHLNVFAATEDLFGWWSLHVFSRSKLELNTIETPLPFNPRNASATSACFKLTPRHASSTTTVGNPKPTASSAVNLTQ